MTIFRDNTAKLTGRTLLKASVQVVSGTELLKGIFLTFVTVSSPCSVILYVLIVPDWSSLCNKARLASWSPFQSMLWISWRHSCLRPCHQTFGKNSFVKFSSFVACVRSEYNVSIAWFVMQRIKNRLYNFNLTFVEQSLKVFTQILLKFLSFNNSISCSTELRCSSLSSFKM